jgi:hypothetical protein
VLKRIQQGPSSRQTIKGAIGRLEGLAINATSLNIPFISRLVAGEVGPAFFEKVLFTPQGQKALESIGDPKISRGIFNQSIAQLSRLLTETDTEVEVNRPGFSGDSLVQIRLQ